MTIPLDKLPLASVAASASQGLGEPQWAEKEAREREELLRFTFDSAPVGIYMADLQERYLKVNVAYQRMVGYSEAELRDKSIFSLTHPDDLPRNQALRAELIAGKREFFEIEKRYYAKSGRLIWVRNKVSLIKNTLGGPSIAITVSQDITERKLAGDALRQSQQNYAALVNSIDGIVWETDAQTFRFNFVSQQAERLLGYPVERWLREPTFWVDHIHADDREWVVDFCVTATREKRSHDFEYRMLASDGRTIWMRDIVTVVVENDRPIRLRGVMVEITGRKLAEQARQESEQRLRQALEDRERLARDLHDGIVQQIYAIGLGLEETQRLLAEDARAAGEGIAGAITRLNDVIREVRRYIAGSAAPQILDGRQLRAELQALAGTVEGARRLRFHVEVDPTAVARLSLDATTHVLNIAREAMSNSLRHSRASNGLVSLLPHRNGVRLVVEDDGCGFDPQCADSSGQGLRNIAARARQLSARLDVGPGSTSGTRIVLDIPVEMHGAE